MGIGSFLRRLFDQQPNVPLQPAENRSPNIEEDQRHGDRSPPSRDFPFKIECYVASEIAEAQSEEIPSPSATLVTTISFGGNDESTYFIEALKTNPRGETGWTLWQTGFDFDDVPVCCKIAFAYPYSEQADTVVAEQLLAETLCHEAFFYDRNGLDLSVLADGLLTTQDVERIFAESAERARLIFRAGASRP